MKTLFIIPARGGSKGLPGKNILPLGGRPLIAHSIAFARLFANDSAICVSTDDDAIQRAAEDTGLQVPFKRPSFLATDETGSYEVIMHALDYYEQRSAYFDNVVLLQPTSPFRKKSDMQAMFNLYKDSIDAVISVKQSKVNPYFNLFSENAEGFLEKMNDEAVKRRQDAPVFYTINGSIYLLNVTSLKKYDSISAFPKKLKYEMDELYSLDIDTQLDFDICQMLLQQKRIEEA